jgi:hypothetical protein
MNKPLSFLPLPFRRALVNNLPLKTNEILLETIYNNKCITTEFLWDKLHDKNRCKYEIGSPNKLAKILEHMMTRGWLKKGRAPERPQTKSSGYKVDLIPSYKNRLPYTAMGLNPLPAFERDDYIYHLILNKELSLLYQMYGEDKHKHIDQLVSNTVYLFEKYHKEIPKFLQENVSMTLFEKDNIDPKKNSTEQKIEDVNLDEEITIKDDDLIIFKKKILNNSKI